MKQIIVFFLASFLFFSACQQNSTADFSLHNSLSATEAITGKADYLNSPYALSGQQLYVIGHQNGSFPNLGWHVQGEMGGIWAHPVKLMDGFQIQLTDTGDNQSFCLNQADQFTNFPIGSKHEFSWTDKALDVQQYQFVPDGLAALIVEVQLANNGNTDRSISLDFLTAIDLRPVWIGERTGMQDHPDTAYHDSSSRIIYGKDTGNDWHTAWSCAQKGTVSFDTKACFDSLTGKGTLATHSQTVNLAPGEVFTTHFFISGSAKGKETATTILEKVRQQAPELIRQKADRYAQMTATARLSIPDSSLQQAYTWTRYCSDWLHFEVPDIGHGLAAGLPDYPWYFGCDQTYSTRGLLHAGMPQMATDIMTTLLELSQKENNNGRIVHEVSTNGAVYNPGNYNETPHYIATAWEVFRWTADVEFLKKAYIQAQKGLDWLMEQDKDGNGYPDGHGMMEIPGMDSEMIDVIVYTQEAFAAAANMAAYFEDMETATRYQEKANQLARQINEDWWVAPKNAYADFRADRQKALELVDAAIVRADTLDKPWSEVELRKQKAALQNSTAAGTAGYTFYYNWVINTPMETGVADSDKAIAALNTFRPYTNPFGAYVTGIDRKAEQEDPDSFAARKAKESFNYTGAVMTLPTGVQAIAEARYGRADQSLDYLKMLTRSFSYAAPGSMYEVSPDYGMLVQAWNIYSIATPITAYMLGIQPEAHEKRIVIRPQLPSTWPEASMENLPVGDNTISVKVSDQKIEVEQTLDWTIEIWAPQAAAPISSTEKKINLGF